MQQDYFTLLRDIINKHPLSKNASVFLYGSCARGDNHKKSDIDIAISPYTKLPHGQLADLRATIEESSIPYRVDLIDLNDTSDSFKTTILTEAIPWNA